MQIAGLVKNSFVDFPGHIAAALFVPGCNMDCWYCHNRALWERTALLDTEAILSFLLRRRGFLDGVVVSGGEPCLQSDLPLFVRRVKDMGYLVKLDTNGLLPGVVEALLPGIDYIALDLKTPPGEISRVVSFDLDDAPIWRSAELIMQSGVDYEFRTTFMPLLTGDDIAAIAQRVTGAKRYVLQQYRKVEGRICPEPLHADAIKKAAEAASQHVQNVIVRGL
jgi:anaerobic ribonucleoside-triphosphate reductase activating protein